ncbi:Hypothetical predicted protein [Octopus vulgaris]|uniref:Uncharacterized protein n=1 Tax=Octopus vulgaris TaxID=6645 RepID=A0AA36B0X7_OCTVU|nr:Hypothetical predicted protein [Octopus vulgaris]
MAEKKREREKERKQQTSEDEMVTENVDKVVMNESVQENDTGLSFENVEGLSDEDRGMIEDMTGTIERSLDMEKWIQESG